MISLAFTAKINRYLSIVRASQSSGVRTEERNRLVGGSSNSAHLHGAAMDLILDTDQPIDVALREALALKFQGIELDLDHENTHLHLDDHPNGRIWHIVRLADNTTLSLVDWLSTQ